MRGGGVEWRAEEGNEVLPTLLHRSSFYVSMKAFGLNINKRSTMGEHFKASHLEGVRHLLKSGYRASLTRKLFFKA
jgi:hypothetical protein